MEAFQRLSGSLEDEVLDARDQAHLLVDVGCDAGFEESVRLAAELLDAPMAAITVLGAEMHLFKAQLGLRVDRMPVDGSFCTYAMQSEDGLVVNDATEDPRFCDSPFVVGAPGIRAYAGAPLVLADGQVLGALCIFDVLPREFSAGDRNTLHLLARQVTIQMQLDQLINRQAKDILDLQLARTELAYMAMHDPLTTLLNRRGIFDHLAAVMAAPGPESDSGATVLFIDLDGFKAVNDTHGHDCGDRVLAAVARRIRNHIPANARAGRLGGDEFVVVLPGRDEAVARRLAESTIEVVSRPIGRDERVFQVAASIGVAVGDSLTRPSHVMTIADRAMYRAKQAGGGSIETAFPAPA